MAKSKKRITLQRYLSSRLLIIIVIVGLLVLLMTYGGTRVIADRSISQYEDDLKSNYDEQVKNEVMTVFTSLDAYYEAVEENQMTLDEAKALAARHISAMKYGDNGNFWIDNLSGDHIVYEHQNFYGVDAVAGASQNTDEELDISIDSSNLQGQFYDYQYPKPGEEEPSPKRGFAIVYGPFDWIIGSGNYIDVMDAKVAAYEDELVEMISNITLLLSGILLLIFILSAAFVTILGKRVGAGLTLLSKDIEAVSRYNLVPASDRDRKFAEGLKTNLKNLIELQWQAKESFATLISLINKNADNVTSKMTKIDTRIADNARLSQLTQEHLSQITQSMQRQVSLISGTNSEVQELSSAIEYVANDSASLTTLAENMSSISSKGVNQLNALEQHAEKTTQGFGQIQEAVLLIEKTAKDISSFVDTIEQISNQTGLLALNASIEAARAGEAGRGFSVVAEEIRKLSEDTTKATLEITEGIQGIQGVSLNAVRAIDNNSNVVKAIESVVTDTAKVFDELAKRIEDLNLMNTRISGQIEGMNTNKDVINRHLGTIVEDAGEISDKLDQIDDRAKEQNENLLLTREDSQDLLEAYDKVKKELEKFTI